MTSICTNLQGDPSRIDFDHHHTSPPSPHVYSPSDELTVYALPLLAIEPVRPVVIPVVIPVINIFPLSQRYMLAEFCWSFIKLPFPASIVQDSVKSSNAYTARDRSILNTYAFPSQPEMYSIIKYSKMSYTNDFYGTLCSVTTRLLEPVRSLEH